MTKLLALIYDGFARLFGLAFPMFSRAAEAPADAAAAAGRWLARAALVSLGLGALWLVNRSDVVGLKNLIAYGALRETWLPLFGLCVYLMLWLGWWLYRVLSLEIEPIGSDFPDIDAAWVQAQEALAKAEIPLDNTPVFLVVGWNSGPEAAVFQSSALRFPVKQAPRDPNGPVRVTANRDGIWVTCPGASVLAQHDPAVGGESADLTLNSLVEDGGGDPDRTNAFLGGGGGATLRIEDIVQGGLAGLLKDPKTRGPRRLADPGLYKARLRHLCRLIARDRMGLCPVNGLLVLLPVTAAEPRNDLRELSASCRADIETALDAFRVRCPVLFLVCDLERLPGFEELVERLPGNRVDNRMGQRFPLVPDLPPGEVPVKVQGAVEWVADTLFPSMVYSLCHVEAAGGEDLPDVLRANSQLFRFMVAMRERSERLTGLIKDCLPAMTGEPVAFGGCYFAGTGEADTQRAFASGVLSRMIHDQDLVTWTAETLENDAAMHRTARLFKAGLTAVIGLGVVAASVLVALLVMRGGGGGGGGAGVGGSPDGNAP